MEMSGTPYDEKKPSRKETKRITKGWIEAIESAKSREEVWRDQAEEAQAFYLMDDSGDVKAAMPRFNILHSNVETIVPAIYNSTPKPDIRPRNGVQDGPYREVADVIEAGIMSQIDDGRLDRVMEKVAQDAYVAGRGILRVQFKSDFEETPEGSIPVNERVCFRCVPFADYLEGPATTWEDVPWVAFRHIISEEEHLRMTGKSSSVGGPVEAGVSSEDRPNERDDIAIWEIWCRETKKVYWIDDKNEKMVRVMDDPLGLRDFFPMPEPLQPLTATGKRKPVCPFTIYREQAKEVDLATTRIREVMSGLKVRGFVASIGTNDLKEIAKAKDNEIVPLKGQEGLMHKGGLANAIFMWPVSEASQVLERLYVQRDAAKQAIYEITGISDILRGESDARETAAAQKLKADWGSMRLSTMQRQVASMVRQAFVVTSEILCRNFTHSTLRAMSGIEFGPEVEQLLGNGLNHYRIDVETDSTIAADRRRFQQEFRDLLEGSGRFFEVMGPVAQMVPEAAEGMVMLYASMVQRFQLGRQGEAAVRHMIDAMAQGVVAARQEQEKAAEESEKAADAQIAMAKIQQENQNREAERAQKSQFKQVDAQIEGQKLDLQDKKLDIDAAAQEGKIDVESAKVLQSDEQADKQDRREREKLHWEMENRAADRNAADREGQRQSADKARDRTHSAAEGERNRQAASADKDKDRDAAKDRGNDG